MPRDRERLFVAALNRADRTFPGEVAAIVEALTGEGVVDNRASRIAVVAIVLSVEVREAVKRGNRVAVAVRAVRA